VGWTSIVGWLTLVTTEAFFGALFFSAAGVIGSNGSYVPAPWKTYLIVLAISTYAMLVNLFGNRFLGKYNDCACKF
jgi:choline transport protein